MIPKLLYHGTSERVARAALGASLLTRSSSAAESNWPKAESHPELVYLTTAYAPFFAMQAIETSDDRMAIIEIDATKLDTDLLRPDEDFLEQASRRQNVPGLRAKTMLGRTRWFRNRLDSFSNMSEASFEHMGVGAVQRRHPGICHHSSGVVRLAVEQIRRFHVHRSDDLDQQLQVHGPRSTLS